MSTIKFNGEYGGFFAGSLGRAMSRRDHVPIASHLSVWYVWQLPRSESTEGCVGLSVMIALLLDRLDRFNPSLPYHTPLDKTRLDARSF
jgi:hypothetical protein